MSKSETTDPMMSPDFLGTTNKMTGRCGVCGRLLEQPDDPSTRSCGGDCLRCMAECGDPDCMASMDRLGLPYERHF